jgi:hypothetical protein
MLQNILKSIKRRGPSLLYILHEILLGDQIKDNGMPGIYIIPMTEIRDLYKIYNQKT